jgi:hypothetical protein
VVPSVVPILNDAFQGDTLGQDEQGFLGRDLECPDLDESRADESRNGGGRRVAVRSQMTFGGAPFTKDRLRKSSSLETTVKSCSRA